jgi:hypothetical protein
MSPEPTLLVLFIEAPAVAITTRLIERPHTVALVLAGLA